MDVRVVNLPVDWGVSCRLLQRTGPALSPSQKSPPSLGQKDPQECHGFAVGHPSPTNGYLASTTCTITRSEQERLAAEKNPHRI